MSDRSPVPLERIIELAAGRLSPEEGARLRAQIAGDPRAAAELAWYEETIALARDTTAEDAPEHVIQRALRIGRPVTAPAAPPLLQRVIATLLADSAHAAPAFGVRSAAPAARQLLFHAGDRNLTVLIAAVRASWQVSGQVLGPEEPGQVELRGAKRTLRTTLNAVSEFTLPPVMAGRYTLVLRQGGYEVVVPELEVGPFSPRI
jgi:anti-sigma factor RsiW